MATPVTPFVVLSWNAVRLASVALLKSPCIRAPVPLNTVVFPDTVVVPDSVTLEKLALVTVTLASVRLLIVVIVSPRATVVFPITMPVLKLASSCDRGSDPVAVAKV